MPTFRQDEKLGTKVPLIKTADFNDKSVTTEKLAEGSVTNSKLAPESVTQDKFDKELLQIFKAAAGLPENLIETIQNVDSTLVDHQRQISSNDDDISDLQTKTKQIKDTVDGIAISGGASVGSAVTYDNTQSGLDAQNIQNAIDELVNNLGHYETNEEWLRAYTDAENKFLWGIRVDGSIDWAVGIPKPIQKTINEIIANSETFQQTLTEAMEAYKATIDEKVAAIDEKKVDKEEGKSLIEDEVKECFRVIENEEFIKAITDADDRVLFGIYRATGKPYYPQNDMYHISQSEEFLWVILDTANHPLLGIQQDGTCWASKAQWLDDIKAIKEALSSIDETLKTFQPKEDGKGLINLDVADSFFYISNDEYIIAVVDAEKRILAGIKYDAQPYFPNHEMYSVITNEEWLYAIIDAENKVLGGFRADDGHMIVGSIDISTFIVNAIVDIADIKERTAHLSTIVNDEYLSVETDAEGKVIGYTAPDGSHYLYKVKSETIPTEFTHIEDLEGRSEITTDSEEKVISYRDSNGVLHENVGINTKHLSAKELVLSNKGVLNFKVLLDKVPNEKNWYLPKFGKVNIKEEVIYLTADPRWSTKDDVVCIQMLDDTYQNAVDRKTLSYYYIKSTLTPLVGGGYDRTSVNENSVQLQLFSGKDISENNGKYFVKKITKVNDEYYLTSSLAKSNGIYDIYYIYGQANSMKVNYTDENPDQTTLTNAIEVGKITDVPPYKAWFVSKELEHYCIADIDFCSFYKKNNVAVGIKYQGSGSTQAQKRGLRLTFYKNATYAKKDKIKIGEMVRLSGYNMKSYAYDITLVKDPVVSNLLREVWESRGKECYPWNIDNCTYNGATGFVKSFPIQTWFGNEFFGLQFFGLKKDERNYMLDGDDDSSGIFVSGANDSITKCFENANHSDFEDEMMDNMSQETANAIDEFCKYTKGFVDGTIEINGQNVPFDNKMLEERIDIDNWIDYWIGLELFMLWDNAFHNVIMYSGRDKKKFYLFYYDLDHVLDRGDYNSSYIEYMNSTNIDIGFWEKFTAEYKDYIINRYAQLRKSVLTIENIRSIYMSYVGGIEETIIQDEKRRWGGEPILGFENVIKYIESRLNYLDNHYFNL